MFLAAEEFATPAEPQRRYLELRLLLCSEPDREAAAFNMLFQGTRSRPTAGRTWHVRARSAASA